MELKPGKSALVTGGASGIGKQRRFSLSGFSLAYAKESIQFGRVGGMRYFPLTCGKWGGRGGESYGVALGLEVTYGLGDGRQSKHCWAALYSYNGTTTIS
jgi:hypothetical protein